MKKCYIGFLIAVLLHGCGNNTESKEKIDLVSYLESENMVKEFDYSSGSNFTRLFSLYIREVDTVIVSKNKIVHNIYSHGVSGGGHTLVDSNHTVEVKYDENIIYTNPLDTQKNRYVSIGIDINKDTSIADWKEYINGEYTEVGSIELTVISKCEYSKITSVNLDNVIYEGDYLKYKCEVNKIKQYTCKGCEVLGDSNLNYKNGKYDIHDEISISIYEKDIGLVINERTYSSNRDYCENTKCPLEDKKHGEKYIIR